MFDKLRIFKRLKDLEKDAHEPYDFTHLTDKLDRLERQAERLERLMKERNDV